MGKKKPTKKRKPRGAKEGAVPSPPGSGSAEPDPPPPTAAELEAEAERIRNGETPAGLKEYLDSGLLWSGTKVFTKLRGTSWGKEERDDVARCKDTLQTPWLNFSVATAPWIKFSVDKEIKDCFERGEGPMDKDSIRDWMMAAESSVIQWVLAKMIIADGRVDSFRSLGRGWLFVLLRRPERKFKVWFESVQRVLMNHEMDIKVLDLSDDELRKYIYGYSFETELVFLTKGIVNNTKSQSSVQPAISIQKLHPGYRDLKKWATTPEIAAKCLESVIPTDEDRRKIAEKAFKHHKRREHARMKSTDGQSEGATGAASPRGGSPVALLPVEATAADAAGRGDSPGQDVVSAAPASRPALGPAVPTATQRLDARVQSAIDMALGMARLDDPVPAPPEPDAGDGDNAGLPRDAAAAASDQLDGAAANPDLSSGGDGQAASKAKQARRKKKGNAAEREAKREEQEAVSAAEARNAFESLLESFKAEADQ